MKEIAIYKRIIFDNIVLHADDYWLLMNLFSFRRTILSNEEYEELKNTYEKYIRYQRINEEDNIYNKLVKEKQILEDSVIKKIDILQRKEKKYEVGSIREITITLSYKCNLNCGYCYQKDHRYDEGIVKSEDVLKIKRFIDDYNKQKDYLEEVTISGGEPLLEENIETIKNILKIFGDKKINFFTNGINIVKHFQDIDFKKISEIQISLDGQDKVISKLSNIKEVKYFDKIIEGIHLAVREGCKIRIVCMFSHGISKWVEDFLEELLKRNIINEIQEIRFSIPTKYKDNQITNNDYFSFEEYLLMKEIIRNNNYNGKVVLDTLTGFARLQSIIGRPLNERYYGKTGICRINEKIPMTFGPNGNIYWCICMEPNEGIIGNYYTNKINKDVLNELISRDIFTVKECRECKIRYLCATGCPSKLFVTGEKILTPVCDAYNNEFLVDRLEEFIL